MFFFIAAFEDQKFEQDQMVKYNIMKKASDSESKYIINIFMLSKTSKHHKKN